MMCKKILVSCLSAIMLLALTMTAIADSPVDWGKGVVRATGIGAGKKGTPQNSGIYRAQAKRAAIMDAQRNLAENVKGVRITAESTMEDLSLQSDVVRTRVDTIIKGMNEVSSQFNEDGTYEVVLEMPLFGGGDSLASAAFLPFKDEQKVSFPAPTKAVTDSGEQGGGTGYTGLIVDCRGMNINFVMSPVIKNADGTNIYGHQNLDYDKIIVNGMVSYATSADDQVSRSRAGSNPLVVKAVSLSDLNANPVLSVADADKVLAANQRAKFLDSCAVVFLK